MYDFGTKPRPVVTELTLMVVDNLQDQFLRPLRTTMTGTIHEQINDIMARHGADVPPGVVSSLSNQFIAPAAAPEMVDGRPMDVRIPGGWQSARFVFLMKVESNVNGMVQSELVTGYTDRIDIANSARGQLHVAPDTTFYVNNVSKLASRSNQYGSISFLDTSYAVLGGALGTMPWHNKETYAMTPFGLLNAAEQAHTDRMVNQLTRHPGTMANSICSVTSAPSLTNRVNNSPTTMMSKMFKSMHDSASLHGLNDITDLNALQAQHQLISSIHDPTYHHSIWITYLTNSRSVGRTNAFEWKTLMDLDPTISNRMMVNLKPYRSTQNASYWYEPTIQARSALIVANMVTSLMTRTSTAYLAFTSTNMFANGVYSPQPTTDVTGMTHVAGEMVNVANMIHPMANVITNELAPVVSENNQLAYHLSVVADVNVKVRVAIRYNNDPEEVFEFPSFADSMISPLLTTNDGLLQSNARDVHTLTQDVFERAMNQSMNQNAPVPMGNPPSSGVFNGTNDVIPPNYGTAPGGYTANQNQANAGYTQPSVSDW